MISYAFMRFLYAFPMLLFALLCFMSSLEQQQQEMMLALCITGFCFAEAGKKNGSLIASDEYGSKAVLILLLPDCTVYSYLTNGILDIFLAALSYESFFLQIWHVLKYCNPRVVLAKNQLFGN